LVSKKKKKARKKISLTKVERHDHRGYEEGTDKRKTPAYAPPVGRWEA